MYKKILLAALVVVVGFSLWLVMAQEKQEWTVTSGISKDDVLKKISTQNETIIDNQKKILQKLDEISAELEKIKKRIK